MSRNFSGNRKNPANVAANDEEDEMDMSTAGFFSDISDLKNSNKNKKNNNNNDNGNDDDDDDSHENNNNNTSSTTILGKRGLARKEAAEMDILDGKSGGGIRIAGTNRVLLPAVGTKTIGSASEWGNHKDNGAARAKAEQRMLEILKDRHLGGKHKQNNSGGGGNNNHHHQNNNNNKGSHNKIKKTKKKK